MLERRKHGRTRDFAAGTIAYGRGPATMDCVVRNASEGGALLLLDEPERAPVRMELATREGVRPARIVWRGESAVGVTFLPAGAGMSALPPAAAVVDLDAVRRRRLAGSDESRLAERIARFVRPSRRPDSA
ncbi:PilZ domain-containing protein [Lichenibacterium dinghuense]|uniref:PilZ domain-containing protein n=1 Tax=Lichenibacterium dinghuense TaxID=2895977 RepID=UPI001F1FF52F|nr:PilZ domain-containing protein [Lichenibacterium sp. 6Y81]